MAQRKSGPVKPPVIDLKAREAAASTDEGKAEEVASEGGGAGSAAMPVEEPQRTPPPRPQARLAMPWSAISIAAVGGALLGAGLVYALGNWVPLPNNVPVIADPAARLDAQEGAMAGVENRLAAVEDQARRTQVSLDATITQLDAGFSEVRKSIAALPATPPATDLGPIEAELKSLSDRVTAIGAGASSADAAALAQTINTIEAGIAGLKTAGADSQSRLARLDQAVAALQQEVATLKTAISTANQTIGSGQIAPAVKLPLVVSGLESALVNGRPYAAEIASIRTLLPDLAVPDLVAGAAETGLPRPDLVATRLAAAVPEILAGRAATSSGDLGTDALEWMKGLLALRPAGEIAGDTPEALVSQLEAAVGRHDFTGAAKLLAALPQPMQAGAGSAGADIVKLATAEQFLTELRARALAPATGANP
ncbi:hypothetical protein [Devosia sp.]|uniref:COG4223 family protein n=1 Tax=Devosia sp. TaxID=1871048 RepID=UPI001ACEA12A|nr:hypothetical protein [Devosia sp.]MBN9308038.1 hypothetical protein [Devosia sp.]